MKKVFIYALIVLSLVLSCTAFNLMSSTVPEPQDGEESVNCIIYCGMIASTYCDGCSKYELQQVFIECYGNEC